MTVFGISTSIARDDDRSRFDAAPTDDCSSPKGQRPIIVTRRESPSQTRTTTSKVHSYVDMHLVDEEPSCMPMTLQDWMGLLAVSIAVPVAYLVCCYLAGALE
jgi:hypothetical protein